MIIAIITIVAAGMLLAAALMELRSLSKSDRAEEPQKEKTKILTPGCSVKFRGREWTIRGFMEDSSHQTIAEIESYDSEKHIIRRTMAAVEDLEVEE